jgi:dihydropteroate synthase
MLLSTRKLLNIRGNLFDLSRPAVMGILNVTPDSFYDGGRYISEKALLERAGKILEEGGSFIDIGGYSTRPGAGDVSPEEEMKRVVPAVRRVIKNFPQSIISIDTFRAKVAEAAINEGAAMINDVSGGSFDRSIFEVAARFKVPYVLMHTKGTPQTMMKEAVYQDLLQEIMDYFTRKITELREAGVNDIILDPGFGFAKTVDHNFELMGKLKYLQIFNLPVLAGISRKSMIYKKLNTTPENTLNGTTVLNTVSLLNGASILRVHDVRECIEAVKLYKAIYP